MRSLTLQGGPADGRTIRNVPDCAWINVPSCWPALLMVEQEYPAPPPVFYLHVYDAITGVWHHGRTPSERIRIQRVELFQGRLARLLDRIDRRFT